MRILSMLLLCLTLSACSGIYINSDDLALYSGSRIYKPLLIPREMADAYPRSFKQILRAIDEWESNVPVNFHIIYGTCGPRGSISIIFSRYITMYDPSGENILGLFSPENKYLLFNERMEADDQQFSDFFIYKICLHELGHVLGLPHIISINNEDGEKTFNFGSGFDILLNSEKDAKSCIMYPFPCVDNLGELSKIEIIWVRHALMHDINLTSSVGDCIYEKNRDGT